MNTFNRNWADIPNTDFQADLFTGDIRHCTGRVLRQSVGRSAVRYYMRVSFSGRSWLVHRAVVMASLRRELTRDEIVRHLDGNTFNNSVSNLMVGTAKSNSMDRYLHGTAGRILRNAHVHEIRQFAWLGWATRTLADRYGISTGHVRAIVTRRRWAGLA